MNKSYTIENITKIPIEVIAEDGTYETTYLILEKKSSDTTIKSVTGEKIIKYDIEGEYIKVYTGAETDILEFKITLNSEYGYLKLEDDIDYELYEITRNIDLSSKTTMDVTMMNVNIKAEDGTEKTYQLSIYKQADLGLKELNINGVVIEYNEEANKYEVVVPNGNTPTIIATANSTKNTVSLINEAGGVIASGTGTLNRVQTLSNKLIDVYKIKVIASGGENYGYKEYDLEIRQKSAETGIIYVKVDNLGTMIDTATKTYSSEVSGKDKYRCRNKTEGYKGKCKNRRRNRNYDR